MIKPRIVFWGLLLFATLVFFSNRAFAQSAAKWQGYVIDRQCAESVKEDSDPRSFIRQHSKDCSLMPTCRVLGYSLYCDRKWLDLDKKGNELTIKLLKASKKKNGIYVEVVGSAQDKVLKVQGMKEIDEPVPTETPQ